MELSILSGEEAKFYQSIASLLLRGGLLISNLPRSELSCSLPAAPCRQAPELGDVRYKKKDHDQRL